MRRLPRPAQIPPAFTTGVTAFVAQTPFACAKAHGEIRNESERWELFKSEQQDAKDAAYTTLLTNQRGLCAYCEVSVAKPKGRYADDKENWQAEHFVPKSASTPTQDWTFDFTNLLLCCTGIHAGTTCGQSKGDTHPQDTVLNPYDLPHDMSLFTPIELEDRLEFDVDTVSCTQCNVPTDIVKQTICTLNLNSPTLARKRYAVWSALQKEIKDLFESQNSTIFDSQLRQDHLCARNGTLPQFYTSRLLCIERECA